MKADRPFMTIKNAALAAVIAFTLSLLIPDVELGRVTALILGMVIYAFFDLRDRLNQIYDATISKSFAEAPGKYAVNQKT